MLTLAYTIFK